MLVMIDIRKFSDNLSTMRKSRIAYEYAITAPDGVDISDYP